MTIIHHPRGKQEEDVLEGERRPSTDLRQRLRHVTQLAASSSTTRSSNNNNTIFIALVLAVFYVVHGTIWSSTTTLGMEEFSAELLLLPSSEQQQQWKQHGDSSLIPWWDRFGERHQFNNNTNDDSSSHQLPNPHWNDSFAFFYNIYIPPINTNDDTAQIERKAKRVVLSQIDSVGNTDARSAFPASISLHYTTIGADDGVLTDAWFTEHCTRNNISCHHLGHHAEGHEELTLQAMYEHCQANRTSRVGYLHAKGLFHSTFANGRRQDHWRKFSTLAVTSELCMQPPDDSCNVCGLAAAGTPFPHIPGNFFTASCDYVNTLIAPREYRDKLTNVVRLERSLANATGRFVHTQFTDNDERMGMGRHAGEHWILSGPESVPCDLDGDRREHIVYQKPKQLNVSRDAFRWGMFPHPGQDAPIYNGFMKTDKPMRVKEYFFLAGNLLKWFHLYGKLPPKGSWVYRFFRDGAEWEEAVEEFGIHAQEVMFSRATNRSLWST